MLIAESPAMREVLELVRVVSSAPIHVLIQGENGTGKELVARMIHESGERRSRSFVPVNCACIPETLIESEFFGHEKGAFSGAEVARKGRFEEADGGTLFLDEIAEMPLQIQPKFLRAIQEGEGNRLGSNRIIYYDVRLISATNKDLAAEVKNGASGRTSFFVSFRSRSSSHLSGNAGRISSPSRSIFSSRHKNGSRGKCLGFQKNSLMHSNGTAGREMSGS